MIKQYVGEFCREARKHGISRLNFYLVESLSRDLSVYNGELENLVRAEQSLMFVEGLVGENSGSVFVENLDPALMEEHIRAILESAEACPGKFFPYELEGLEGIPDLESCFPDLDMTVQAMCRAEQTAYAFDSRIKPGAQVHMEQMQRRVTLANEQEIFAADVEFGGTASIRLAVQDGQMIQPGGGREHFLRGEFPDMDKLARKAAEGAVSRLGAGSYRTGHFPVVLDARVVAELLNAFMPAFFARNVQSRMSALAGRMGQKLAAECISIVEDPALPKGFSSRRFDDEGISTSAKTIIDKGVLNCWLYNRQSAREEGIASSGNGFKGQFNDAVSTGYTNVYIPQGMSTRAQLLEHLGDGLLITGVSGVFAGAKPNSGDFSLISSGYRVENGRQAKAVSQITIAGNFFEMLNNVLEVADDEHWICTYSGNVRTPSLRISGLAISGKE